MPIIKSSIKRDRLNKIQYAARSPQISHYHTAVKNFEKAVKTGKDNINDLYKKTSSVIDKAQSKNLIKKNKASREKGRLYKLLKETESKK